MFWYLNGGVILAESGGDYGWIVYLVIFFFVFIGPILKKVAESLGMTKGGQKPGQRPGRQTPAGQQGPVKQMLNEVESYFRQSREQAEKQTETKSDSKTKYKQYSEYDMKYQERKRELEQLRIKREERFSRRSDKPSESSVKPVLPKESERLVVIEEPGAVFAPEREFHLSSGLLSERKEAETKDFFGGETKKARHTSVAGRGDFFNMFSGLPEMAKIVIFSEVLSKPKSLRSETDGL